MCMYVCVCVCVCVCGGLNFLCVFNIYTKLYYYMALQRQDYGLGP